MTEQQKMLERVRALLAKADSTPFPAEADTFRAKADALMMKHRISSWQLKDPDQNSRIVQITRYDMSWYESSPHGVDLWNVLASVANHCRVKLVPWMYSTGAIPVGGTEADLEYMDVLFTSIMLELSKGLEPKPNPGETMIEYLVRAKEAGMKWERIGELMLEFGIADFPEYKRNVGVRFTKLYTDYCTEHGRPRLRTSPIVYQRSYSNGFRMEISRRLAKIREEAREQYDWNKNAEGMELVLADITSVIDAKIKDLFGPTPPGGGVTRARSSRKMDVNAHVAGQEAAKNVDLHNRRVGGNRPAISQ
jgi:hypothetical protein